MTDFETKQFVDEAAFKAALLDELGITDHPKANLLYSKAYARGHAYGFHEIRLEAEDLVNLIL